MYVFVYMPMYLSSSRVILIAMRARQIQKVYYEIS